MNISIITSQLGGTGGAINCIAICNKFVKEGHKVKVFSELMPDESMIPSMKFEVSSLKEAPSKLVSDVTLAFNINKKTELALLSSTGRKFARLGIINREYEDVMRNKDIVKITTTTYESHFIEDGQGVAIPGPVDTTNFYPEGLQRDRNLILCYVKKSGWVGIVAINQAQAQNSKLIFASLTDDGLDSCPIKSKYPIVILGAPAHLRSHLRYCYNRAGMFVDTHSNGLWGWNCCVGEAMLCKCPVVATDSPVFGDIVLPDITALTAPNNEANEVPTGNWKTRPNPEKIANQILKLYASIELANSITNNAYELVRKYDINYWYSKFMELV